MRPRKSLQTLAMCAKAMASKSKLHMMFSQTKVLASNRQTTDGMPGHQKLHHGRLSGRKKVCRVVIIENVVREGVERAEREETYHE